MEENKKLNWFQRFYMAVFKIEDYHMFFAEKWTKALGYFTILTLLVACMFSVVSSLDFSSKFERGYSFFKTLPEFEYKDEKISENVYASGYDEEFSTFFVMDTNKDYEEYSEVEKISKEEHGNNFIDSSVHVFVYKSKAFINYYGSIFKLDYKDNLDAQGITEFSRNEIVDVLENGGKNQVYIFYYIFSVVTNFISIFVTFILDIIMLAIFADIIGMLVCKVKIKFREGFALGTYAVTLPILISLIYSIVNYFTGFYMEYISYMTLIIEYVYVVAVIFMIKTDRIKMQEELAKIEITRAEVAQELEEKNDAESEEKIDDTEEKVEEKVETKEDTSENQIEADLQEENKEKEAEEK